MKTMMMMRMILPSAADNVNANGYEVGLTITAVSMVMRGVQKLKVTKYFNYIFAQK